MSHFKIFSLGLLLISGLYSAAFAKNIRLESGVDQVSLIELYSSEGCSSCPPADEWLANLKKKPGLWKKHVPVEFHVDYWNYLGWHDDFSKKDFTARQGAYSSLWGKKSVYTPNFILNGDDWKPGRKPTKKAKKNVGNLIVKQISEKEFEVEFAPTDKQNKPYKVYGTRLAGGLSVVIRAGENKGRTLKHEFVALSLQTESLKKSKNTYKAKLSLPKDTTTKAKSHAVAFWVGEGSVQTPIQAVGGDLPTPVIKKKIIKKKESKVSAL